MALLLYLNPSIASVVCVRQILVKFNQWHRSIQMNKSELKVQLYGQWYEHLLETMLGKNILNSTLSLIIQKWEFNLVNAVSIHVYQNYPIKKICYNAVGIPQQFIEPFLDFGTGLLLNKLISWTVPQVWHLPGFSFVNWTRQLSDMAALVR